MRSTARRLVAPVHVVLVLGVLLGGLFMTLMLPYGANVAFAATVTSVAAWVVGLVRWRRGEGETWLLVGDVVAAGLCVWLFMNGIGAFVAWLEATIAVLGILCVMAMVVVGIGSRASAGAISA